LRVRSVGIRGGVLRREILAKGSVKPRSRKPVQTSAAIELYCALSLRPRAVTSSPSNRTLVPHTTHNLWTQLLDTYRQATSRGPPIFSDSSAAAGRCSGGRPEGPNSSRTPPSGQKSAPARRQLPARLPSARSVERNGWATLPNVFSRRRFTVHPGEHPSPWDYLRRNPVASARPAQTPSRRDSARRHYPCRLEAKRFVSPA